MLDFPASPNPGDTYLSYIWDGTKWGVQAGVGGVAGVASFNTRTGAITTLLADITSATGTGTTAQSNLGLARVAATGAYADISGVPAPPPASSTSPAMDGIATVGTETAWAHGDHIHPRDTSAQNNVGRNRLHNAGFSINQRGYVSSTALAAGIYGHDRWKAGAGGCTYTFTQAQPFTTITITAGSLQHIVEDRNVEGGNYMLSWFGTAQGRVNAGSYAASPVTVTGLAAGTAVTIEFNTGTLGRVQFEPGSVATPLEKPDPRYDLANCQRFATPLETMWIGYNTIGAAIGGAMTLPVSMRAAPTVTITNSTGSSNSGGYTAGALSPRAVYGYGVPTATGPSTVQLLLFASSDL